VGVGGIDAAGYASEIDKIVEIAHAHGIKIIEDCSQSHCAKHKAKPVGRRRQAGSRWWRAEAVRAEGIDLNPHYKYVVCEWPYIQPHLADDFEL
jgi:hypothetical protein